MPHITTDSSLSELRGVVEAQRAFRAEAEHAIGDTKVQVGVDTEAAWPATCRIGRP